jgi:hypothetical protein
MATLFNTSNSMSDFWSTCSGGLSRLNPNNSIAVNVRMPCSGVDSTTGNAWDSGVCSADNLMRIAYAVDT